MQHFWAGFEKQAKELTTRARKRISDENFALPGRRYPIHDRAHAANAKARVAQFGTKSEQEAVNRAVHARYPDLGKEAAEQIPGGLAEGKSESEFPKDQLRMGEKVEKEHTKDPAVAKEIAKDHLVEHKDYYSRLKKARL